MAYYKIDGLNNIKFDFDDILLVPSQNTSITSRYNDVKLPELPLFVAPMDTVIDLNNINTFVDKHINVCVPRTIPYEEYQEKYFLNCDGIGVGYLAMSREKMVFPSLGFGDLDRLLEDKSEFGLNNFTTILIDVANGHMKKILEYCVRLKMNNKNLKIMVGNIANPETYRWYAESGVVDYIRVGIGNGNGCLTTKQTGIGYPKASLINEIYKIKKEMYDSYKYPDALPKIVADGGMKDYADIVKALALGADYVMIGSLFNKTMESCAQSYFKGFKVGPKTARKIFNKGWGIYKYYRGMSTKGAQKAMGKNKFKTSEGVVRYRKVEYTLDQWLENFKHYLKTAMSYSNANTLDDFIGKAEFCHITKNAYDRFNK